MIDTDKQAFKDMINAVFTIYGKPLPEKEMLRIWWHKLERYDFSAVGRAFDKWTDTPNKLPQPADIVQMCKPREAEYHALPPPVSHEDNKKHADKLALFIHERIKPKTDYHAWAKRILKNPQNFPDTSVEAARKLLGDKYDSQS
jgi:hypothetical protein